MRDVCRKKFSVPLMFACLLVMTCVVFAAGDATQPLWGWHLVAVNAILGFASPFVTSLIAKSEWASKHKRWLFVGVSGAATIGVGVYIKALTKADLSPDIIFDTLVTVFTVGSITYQLFARNFGNLTKLTTKKN